MVRLAGDQGIRGHDFHVQEEVFIRALQRLPACLPTACTHPFRAQTFGFSAETGSVA
jgi:hypothetical protein